MAQLKDTTITGNLAVSGSSNIGGGEQVSGGDLTLYTSGTGDSPAVIFQRGTLTDNYNDWKIVDSGGQLKFQQRGINSTSWSNEVSLSSAGDITATSFTGSGANLTGVTKDVKIDNASILSNGVADIKTSSSHPYNASTNVLATMADVGAAGGGTVTSVGVSNATDGGLTISGSPVTSSGTITVGHTNKLASAQTTQKYYPITFDKNGHITGWSQGVTSVNPYYINMASSLNWSEMLQAYNEGRDIIAYDEYDDNCYNFYKLTSLNISSGTGTSSDDYALFTNLIVDGSANRISADGMSWTGNGVGWEYQNADITGFDVVSTYSSTGTDAVNGTAVNAALQTLDSSITATTNQAISAITITDGKISNSSKVTIPTVTNSYSSTGTDAVSGQAVSAALQTLDSSITATTGQAISAITVTDGKIASSSKINVGDANQNAFSNVKVGSTTIAADTTTDTLELVAGTGITLTPDATNDKVTIASTASGDNSYRVTLSYDSTNDSFSTDKTYNEIVAAINSGKQAYIYDNTGYHKYTIGSYELGLTDIFAWCVSTGAVGAGYLYNLNFTCYNLLLKAEIVYMIDSSDNVSTSTDSMGASSAVTDVRINNNSIVTAFGSSRIANFATNTAYNSSTNKIATMADIESDAYKITLSYNNSTDEYSIDKTYAEVEAAVRANKYVYIYDNTSTIEAGYQGSTIVAPFSCMAPTEDWFFFDAIAPDYNSEEQIIRYILADDGVWVDQYSLARELPYVNTSDNGKVLKVVNGAWSAATSSSGGGLFLVNFSSGATLGSYTADKSFAQIVSAIDSGSVVMGQYIGEYFSLTYFYEGDEQTDGDVRFERYSNNLGSIEWFGMNTQGQITYGNESPWETYTDNAIGNAMAASY